LHEFETILFADTKGFQYCFNPDICHQLSQIMAQFPNPEDINDSPLTAPSKRILGIVPEYNKPFQGNMIALENGLEVVLAKCPHFTNWVGKLKNLAN
jgi:Domain of unknown function (DUF4276)